MALEKRSPVLAPEKSKQFWHHRKGERGWHDRKCDRFWHHRKGEWGWHHRQGNRGWHRRKGGRYWHHSKGQRGLHHSPAPPHTSPMAPPSMPRVSPALALYSPGPAPQPTKRPLPSTHPTLPINGFGTSKKGKRNCREPQDLGDRVALLLRIRVPGPARSKLMHMSASLRGLMRPMSMPTRIMVQELVGISSATVYAHTMLPTEGSWGLSTHGSVQKSCKILQAGKI